MDALLKNPWGLVYGPGTPFWVSDEDSGWSTLYDGSGNPLSLQVVIPPASGTSHGTPTGIVYNGSTEFQIMNWTSVFIFATLDGTISGWSHFEPSTALIGATSPGSVYTGLAITNRASGNLLYAADSANNRVDVYNGSFSLVSSITFPTVPAGFAPFNVQDIDNLLYVTFASTSGGTGGFVYVVHEDGTGARELTHSSALNQPWGLAIAPSGFGPLSGALLVGNNSAFGSISAFNRFNGKFIGKVTDLSGVPLHFTGLWALRFGGGTANNGQVNHLYFTSGPADTNGYFGVIWFRGVN
jgi:uncharacterized protein (TIGR03118 family)